MGYHLFRGPQISFLFVTVFVGWGLWDCVVLSLSVRGLAFCVFVYLCVCVFVGLWV